MPILLNQRHEMFAQAIASGRSTTEAYAHAGYSRHRGNCIRLRANESIRKRVAELQQEATKDVKITLETLAQMFLEDRQLAYEAENPNAASATTERLARLLGYSFDGKKQADASPPQPDRPANNEGVFSRAEMEERFGAVSSSSASACPPAEAALIARFQAELAADSER